MLDIPESLFVVESVSSNTKEKENGDKGGGEEGDGEIGDDEEEGMISDPNTEVLPLTSPLIKVTHLYSVAVTTNIANQCIFSFMCIMYSKHSFKHSTIAIFGIQI